MAQLNSAPDYGSGGCKFESCRGHYIYIKELEKSSSFFLFIVHIIVHIFVFLTYSRGLEIDELKEEDMPLI